MRTRTKVLIGLIVLSLVDMVIPLPVLGIILIHVLLNRPPWFENLVREIYYPQ